MNIIPKENKTQIIDDKEKSILHGNGELTTALKNDGTFQTYENAVACTATYPGKGSYMGLLYALVGLSGEIGELLNKLKKVMRGDESPSSNEDLKDELGDVLWCTSAAAKELGTTLQEIAHTNSLKTIKRAKKRMECAQHKGNIETPNTTPKEGQEIWEAVSRLQQLQNESNSCQTGKNIPQNPEQEFYNIDENPDLEQDELTIKRIRLEWEEELLDKMRVEENKIEEKIHRLKQIKIRGFTTNFNQAVYKEKMDMHQEELEYLQTRIREQKRQNQRLRNQCDEDYAKYETKTI